jgi:hypothetical protein
MQASRLTGFAFIALASVMFTAERIAAQFIWVAQKASVAVHGSGSWPNSPDYSPGYSDPAMWVCLGIGVVLVFYKRKTLEG